MKKVFNASEIIDGFNSLFPIEVNHSGGHHFCEDFTELEEWDCASGELWANYLDNLCISAEFSLKELENGGDYVLFNHWFEHMVDNFINGNLTDCFNDFEELKENDSDELFRMLLDHTLELEILRLYAERIL